MRTTSRFILTVAAALLSAAFLTLPVFAVMEAEEARVDEMTVSSDVEASAADGKRDVEDTIWYQGFLANVGDGEPITGTVDVVARIYDAALGGSVVWGPETHLNVTVTEGWFHVELGSSVDLLEFDDPPYYLDLRVDDEVMDARMKIGSVPMTHATGLPVKGTLDSAGTACVQVTQEGAYSGIWVDQTSGSSSNSALFARHAGPGAAVRGLSTGSGPAVKAEATGTGLAGQFLGNVTVDDTLTTDYLKIPTGAFDNYVLMSDADGLATWTSLSFLGDGDWTVNGNNQYSAVSGNVGIGTTSPTQKLHIGSGNVLLSGSSNLYFEDSDTFIDLSANDLRLSADDDVWLIPDDDVLIGAEGGGAFIHIDNTTNRMELGGTVPSTRFQVNPTGSDWSWTEGTGHGDLYIGDNTYGLSFGVATGGGGAGDCRIWADGGVERIMFGNPTHNSEILTISSEGRVGVGTTLPETPFHAVADPVVMDGRCHVIESTADLSSNNDLLELKAGASSNADAQIIEGQLGSNVVFRVNADGEVTADGSFTGGGADFAEMIRASGGVAAIEPGDVLVIDPTSQRSIEMSTEPSSSLVAGIYSTDPGFVGSTREWDVESAEGESTPLTRADMAARYGEVPMAVVGIVPCKVSAENGPIAVGDLLVTSGTPGHAMRAENPRAGTILGKALDSMAAGTGTIEVLLTLQ